LILFNMNFYTKLIAAGIFATECQAMIRSDPASR
jgi:hypothetical protein